MKAPDRGPSSFRVGTWNLAGRWSPADQALLEAAQDTAARTRAELAAMWALTETTH